MATRGIATVWAESVVAFSLNQPTPPPPPPTLKVNISGMWEQIYISTIPQEMVRLRDMQAANEELRMMIEVHSLTVSSHLASKSPVKIMVEWLEISDALFGEIFNISHVNVQANWTLTGESEKKIKSSCMAVSAMHHTLWYVCPDITIIFLV